MLEQPSMKWYFSLPMGIESDNPSSAANQQEIPMPSEVTDMFGRIRDLLRANLQTDWRTAPLELLTYRLEHMAELAEEAYELQAQAIDAARHNRGAPQRLHATDEYLVSSIQY